MITTDRVKEALAALLGWGYPRVDYFTTYRARVVKQSSDLSKVDIIPDDKRIPRRSDVPIKWGIPGCKAQIATGCFVNHGWDNGDPTSPYVALIESGATTIKLVLEATNIYLGAEAGAKKLATKDDIDAHTHLAGKLKAPPGGGPVTGATGVPVVPITGTTKTWAV